MSQQEHNRILMQEEWFRLPRNAPLANANVSPKPLHLQDITKEYNTSSVVCKKDNMITQKNDIK